MIDPAAPPAADAGDISPPIERAAPRASATERPSFAEQRHAQEQARAQTKPPAPQEAPLAPEEPAADPAASQDEPKFKIGKFEISETALAEMIQRQAAEDVRKGTLPQTPEAYRAELPADFKPPAGVEFKLDTSNPALGQLKAVAHKHGLTQDAVNELIGVYAGNEVGTEARIRAAAAAEVTKLGASGTARVDAVTRFMDGSDLGVLKSTLVTAAQIEAWERHINKLTSQGSAPYSNSHRVPPETNAIPNYDKMTFAQRREAQDNLLARRGGR
jgi:hypothetical protein